MGSLIDEVILPDLTNEAMDRQQIANHIGASLRQSYPWADIVVVVYEPLSGPSRHAIIGKNKEDQGVLKYLREEIAGSKHNLVVLWTEKRVAVPGYQGNGVRRLKTQLLVEGIDPRLCWGQSGTIHIPTSKAGESVHYDFHTHSDIEIVGTKESTRRPGSHNSTDQFTFRPIYEEHRHNIYAEQGEWADCNRPLEYIAAQNGDEEMLLVMIDKRNAGNYDYSYSAAREIGYSGETGPRTKGEYDEKGVKVIYGLNHLPSNLRYGS